MERELGSHTEIIIYGGEHDGAKAQVRSVRDEGGRRLFTVQLPDGTMLEVARHIAGPDDFPRETGT